MQARAYRACETCRRSRRRCTGGPPCETCLERGKQTCEFIATAPRSKSFGQNARLNTDACLRCRSKNAICTGGPPCEECVEGSDMCSFDTERHREDHLHKGRSSACTTRGSESTCEFVKTTKGDSETTTTHTPQHQSDGAAEPRWNAVAESEPIQQPESTLNVGTDNRPSPYTLTAVDARRVRRNESLGCSKLRSATNSATSLPDLSETSSLEASDSDGSSHASSETGCSSYDELLHVLPSRQMIDSLIVKYFSSISTVNIAYQECCDLLIHKTLVILCRQRCPVRNRVRGFLLQHSSCDGILAILAFCNPSTRLSGRRRFQNTLSLRRCVDFLRESCLALFVDQRLTV